MRSSRRHPAKFNSQWDNPADKAVATATVRAFHMTPVKTPSPKKPSNDGDVHIAITTNAFGLPLVAEICNAKDAEAARATVKDAIKQATPLTMTGVLRLWAEHSGNHEFVQGDPVEEPEGTNPDHVLELHPLLQINDDNVTSSFKGIADYAYKEATSAFNAYENTPCAITRNKTTTTLTTRGVGYNYTQFLVRLDEDPTPPPADADSKFVYTDLYSLDGEKVVGGHVRPKKGETAAARRMRAKRRLVFINNTLPSTVLQAAKKGEWLRLVGIPSINLSLVQWRGKQGGAALTWSLPYQMIILDAESVPADERPEPDES